MRVIFLIVLILLAKNSYSQANSIAGALSSLFNPTPSTNSYPPQYSNTPISNSQISNAIAGSLASNPQTLPNVYPPQSSTQNINNALASALTGNPQPNYNTNQNINNAIANSLAGNNQNINSLSSPTLGDALLNSINRTVLANDRDFVNFLYSNGVPNATVIPTYQECSSYRITANGNLYQSTDINYRVTCKLPNGRTYSEPCYGRDSCDYLTCKFLKCGRLQGGSVTRIRI